MTGALNLGVSFFLAFRVALRSRGIRLADREPDPQRFPPPPLAAAALVPAAAPQLRHHFGRLTMRMPLWTLIVPAVALPLAGVALAMPPGPALALVCALALCAAVIASVHHAEVVAHRVGEPFGTLILAVSVTVIEVALIVSMMLAGGSDKSGLARDTIFSAIMIVCNGAVGLCVIAGGLKHHVQSFRLEGATSALAALVVMATLSLVLPVFTTSVPGPDYYSTSQLAFAAVASLALWAVFVFVQTVRHRDYFLPPGRRRRRSHRMRRRLRSARPGPASASSSSRCWP